MNTLHATFLLLFITDYVNAQLGCAITAICNSTDLIITNPLGNTILHITDSATGFQQIGLGTSSPRGALDIVGNGGVIFQGVGAGTTPTEGAGVCFMWFPAKAAVRSGTVSADQWDDTNIGVASSAWGDSTVASGDRSIAIGFAASATGINSISMGDTTVGSGDKSISMGAGTVASALCATALGSTSVASGNMSTAMGQFSQATGVASTAMGFSTAASGEHATALGEGLRLPVGPLQYQWEATLRQ